MGGLSTGLAPEWLALRENADADARAESLLDPLRAALSRRSRLLIRDLGCGTGSMGRWLAPRLPGPQHWVLHDRDTTLLAEAAAAPPKSDRDGGPVRVTPKPADLTAFTAADLSGTSLVTASALLDLLTLGEVILLAEACMAARVPALITLSVLGRVELDPPDLLDGDIEAAFNDHQRREVRGRRQLGPDAFDAATDAFSRDFAVFRQPSPWRLGPADAALTAEWLRGWVFAAVQHRPDLAEEGQRYLDRRLAANAAGELRVTVAHGDLLALPEVPA
jgi:trans-aconitate methyltransferase